MGVESANPFDAIRSLRNVRRERLQKELFLRAKDAKLRSGARGMQARKALIAMEQTVAEFDKMYDACRNLAVSRLSYRVELIVLIDTSKKMGTYCLKRWPRRRAKPQTS